MEDQDFYTIKEFARKLRVHPNTIRNGIKTGHINAFRTGTSDKSSYKIPHTEIHNMARKQYETIAFKMAKTQIKDDYG